MKNLARWEKKNPPKVLKIQSERNFLPTLLIDTTEEPNASWMENEFWVSPLEIKKVERMNNDGGKSCKRERERENVVTHQYS